MEFIVSLRTIKPSLLNNYKKVEKRVEFVCVLELTENTFKYFFFKEKESLNLEIFKRVRFFYKCISRPVQQSKFSSL